jgi:YHS domain-containing protein
VSFRLPLLLLAALSLVPVLAFAGEGDPAASTTAPAASQPTTQPAGTQPATTQPASGEVSALTNTSCPVMGGPVNPNIHIEYEGKTVYFCCNACPQTFLAHPERYVANLPQFRSEEPAQADPSPQPAN